MVSISSARVDITPSVPITMGAAGTPTATATEVIERLEANIVCVKPATGSEPSSPIVLVSLDVLYPGAELRARLLDKLPWLSDAHLFLAATHNHRAPMVDTDKPRLGTVDNHYLNRIVVEISNAISALVENPSHAIACTLHLGSGTSTAHTVNRRRHRRWWNLGLFRGGSKVHLGPNPEGPTDESVTVAEFRDSAGETVAVIWNYACHPVGHPTPDAISAHFPGAVRSALRVKHRRAQLPVLYFQGFSGDTRPTATIAPTSPRTLLRTVLFGPNFANMDGQSYANWTSSVAQSVASVHVSSEPSQVAFLRGQRHYYPGSEVVEGYAGNLTYHVVSIGHALKVVGINAEVVSEYADWLRGTMGTAVTTMCVGCIDDTLGYLPTEAMLGQGGYEALNYCEIFGYKRVLPGVERRVKEGFVNAAQTSLETQD